MHNIENDMEANPSYQREEYIIHKSYGEDATDYVIYHNGKVI